MTPPDVERVFAERRRRVTRIRKHVTVLAVTLFLTLWGMIFVQLVSGHDPALLAKATSATTTSTASTPVITSSSGSTGSSSSTGSSTSTSNSSGNSSSSSSTPVTTSQS